MKAIYPGSFDPITFGHLDIIVRASKLYDHLYILIMENDDKKGMFTNQERLEIIQEVCKDLENVSVVIGNGLTVDMAKKLDAQVMIRGIRAVSDYEYEMQLAMANMNLNSDIETLFMLASPVNSFLSSSTAKSVLKAGGDIRKFVPDYVAKKMEEKLQ